MSASPALVNIRENLLANVNPKLYQARPDLLSFIVQTRTNDPQLDLELQRLPWNEWDFIQYHYRAGIALSTNTAPILDRPISKLRALVICGKYENPADWIDLQPDLDALKQLGDAVELEIWISDPLKQSKLELLKKLDRSTYHLLFFCGHSSATNQIQLNDREDIDTDDHRFKKILTQLKNRGLILAFFNSCDGLGIARALMSVGIPYVVVMKELVHDRVAHEFIKKFLAEAIEPEIPIHIAVDKARKELQWLDELPHVEFLPILLQNPEQPPFYINPAPSDLASKLNTDRSPQISQSPLFKYRLFATIPAIILLAIGSFFWINFSKNNDLQGRISAGEAQLKGADRDSTLEVAHSYFQSKQYDLSMKEFDRYLSLEDRAANPEIVIFRNNAKAYSDSIATGAKVLKIATSVPLANNRPIAEEILRGVAQYQTKYNHHDRTKLVVVIGSDDNSPILSTQIAKKFVADADILAIVGHNASEASEAAAIIYNRQVVMISPTSFSLKLKKDRPADSIYRMVPQMTSFASQLADYIKKSDRTNDLRVGTCVDPDSPDNNSFQSQFSFILRGKASKPLDLDCGSFDNIDRPQRQQLIVKNTIANRIDTILVAPHVNKLKQTVAFMKAIRQNPALKNIKLIGSPSLYTKYVSDRNQDKLLNGLVLIVPYFPERHQLNYFINNFENEWKIPLVTWRTSMAYAATAAIAQNLSPLSTRSTIQQGMSKTDRVYDTNTGLTNFSFNKSGERNTDDAPGTLIELTGTQFANVSER